MRYRRSGFTIVELLIVIVVIAILAAITTVAYTGVQQRANNSAKIAAVKQLVTLIRGYTTLYDTYPSNGVYCATAENQCTNGSGNVQTSDNAALLTELGKMGSVPQVSNVKAGNSYGVQYIYESANTFNGIPAPVRLEYWLQGDNIKCGTENVQNNTAATASVTSTTGYTASSGGRTTCWIRIGMNI